MTTNRSKRAVLALVTTLSIPLAAAAQAETGAGLSPRNCPGSAATGRRAAGAFDPKTVTTIRGEILDIQRIARGRHEGVHLTVAMGTEKISVHLGPGFYVDAQELRLAKGDEVEVKGSRTTFDGQSTIVAQELRRGDQTLALRDDAGIPLWRGQGMRGR